MIPALLWIPVFVTSFLVLRLFPIWPTRHRGVDAYFFLLCAETFRRKWRLPIVLPRLYLLEPREQWYPPLFPVFCALLPPSWLRRRYWLVNHLLDFIPAFALTAWAIHTVGLFAGFGIGVLYAANGWMVTEYAGLTSRPLATLFFYGFLTSVVIGLDGNFPLMATAGLAAALLLFTHKLTVQLLWVLVPVLALVEGEPLWVAILAGSYVLAFAAGGRLFVNVLRAHADIVSFWARNWRFLGAHQVRASPLYGKEPATGTAFHRGTDLRSALHYARQILHQNYFILMVPLALPLYASASALERVFLVTAIVSTGWAFATLYVPKLRCLGVGSQYVKFAMLPSLVVTGAILSQASTSWPWILAAACALLTLRYYVVTTRSLRVPSATTPAASSPELSGIIETLRNRPGARVLCLPLHLSDTIAYHARRPVLWGTHGYGFRAVEHLFPVLRRPLREIVAAHGINHLLLDERYVTPAELRIADRPEETRSGSLVLFRLDDTSIGDPPISPASVPCTVDTSPGFLWPFPWTPENPGMTVIIGSLRLGGTENHIAQVLPRLRDRGIPVMVYLLGDEGPSAAPLIRAGIPIVHGPRADLRYTKWLPPFRGLLVQLSEVWCLAGFLRRTRPGICLTFLPSASIIGGLASTLVPGVALILSRRSLNLYQSARHTVLDRLERFLQRRAIVLLANSRAVADDLLAEGAPRERVAVLRNGIDAGPLTKPVPRDEVRKREGIPPEYLVLLVPANLISYKGHLDLIEALGTVAPRMPHPWILLCAGRDDGEGLRILAHARDLGCADRIRLLGERDDMGALYAASDIVVLPSHQEGFANVLLEAMACTRPIIATAVGGNREAVLHEETGLLVPSSDHQAMADAILRLAEDPALCQRFGEAGRRRFESRFTLERCVSSYVRLYETVLATPGTAVPNLRFLEECTP